MTATSWDEVIGQSAAVGTLRRSLAADEVAHAWLLVGPAGVGQRELTRAFAMALNCPEPSAADVGCGVCSTCDRIGRGTHPAVAELEPEGANHVVDAVRGEWIPSASRTMTEGRRRIMHVVAADRMNEAAQNAFLKILEEPPASVVWVLEAQDPGMLLDTVVSRCRRLTLVPWGPDEMQALAGRLGLAAPHRDVLARAALGSPERLRELADGDVADARNRHLAVVDRLATGGPGQVAPIAKEIVDWSKTRMTAAKAANEDELVRLEEAFGVDGGRGWPPGLKARVTRRFERLERQQRARALQLALEDLASWTRDLLVVAGGGSATALVNVDHVDEARRDAARLTPADLVSCLRAVDACRDALERNGNPQLQLERMLLVFALALYANARVGAQG